MNALDGVAMVSDEIHAALDRATTTRYAVTYRPSPVAAAKLAMVKDLDLAQQFGVPFDEIEYADRPLRKRTWTLEAGSWVAGEWKDLTR